MILGAHIKPQNLEQKCFYIESFAGPRHGDKMLHVAKETKSTEEHFTGTGQLKDQRIIR